MAQIGREKTPELGNDHIEAKKGEKISKWATSHDQRKGEGWGGYGHEVSQAITPCLR